MCRTTVPAVAIVQYLSTYYCGSACSTQSTYMGNLLARRTVDPSGDAFDRAATAAAQGDVPNLTTLLQDQRWNLVQDDDGADGVFLIHIAAQAGQRQSCECLLEHGSPHAPRTAVRGETPAQVAAAAGHGELAEWLSASMPAVLFLDVDGVLNSQESRALDPSHMPSADALANLVHIAHTAGPLRVVLSSTWRLDVELRLRLSEALRGIGIELAGDTPDLTCSGDRVDEIISALWKASSSGRDILPWLAIDDMDLLYMNPKLHPDAFVRTDDAVGLTRAKAEEAVEKLTKQRQAVNEPGWGDSASLPRLMGPWSGH